MSKPKVLYLLHRYPQVSQTYIENEREILATRYDLKIVAFNRAYDLLDNPDVYTIIARDDTEALQQIIKEFKPDVIHGHWLFIVEKLFEAAQLAQRPFTIRGHSFDILARNVDLHAKAKIVNSEYCLGMLTFPFTIPILKAYGFQPEKLYPCFPIAAVSKFADRSVNGVAVMNVGACRPKKDMPNFIMLASLVKEREFNLYALGTEDPAIHILNKTTGNRVAVIRTLQPREMPPEYKKHEWLVYTASPKLNTVGWPVAIAEAQASGVGVCMQKIRPDLAEYVGGAGYLFETIEEAARIISRPFPHEKRELGFELAKKSDVQSHISILLELWKSQLA